MALLNPPIQWNTLQGSALDQLGESSFMTGVRSDMLRQLGLTDDDLVVPVMQGEGGWSAGAPTVSDAARKKLEGLKLDVGWLGQGKGQGRARLVDADGNEVASSVYDTIDDGFMDKLLKAGVPLALAWMGGQALAPMFSAGGTGVPFDLGSTGVSHGVGTGVPFDLGMTGVSHGVGGATMSAAEAMALGMTPAEAAAMGINITEAGAGALGGGGLLSAQATAPLGAIGADIPLSSLPGKVAVTELSSAALPKLVGGSSLLGSIAQGVKTVGGKVFGTDNLLGSLFGNSDLLKLIGSGVSAAMVERQMEKNRDFQRELQDREWARSDKKEAEKLARYAPARGLLQPRVRVVKGG